MRIALVYDALYPDAKGGVERRVWEIASRLATQGHDVHLLAPQSWPGDASIERDGVTLRGVCRRRELYTSRGRRAVFPALAHAWGVWRLLRRQRFDVVDCQIPAHLAALTAWVARRNQGKLLVTWHEAWGNDWVEEMGPLGHVGRVVERIVARLPARHLAVSSHTAAGLASIGGPTVPVVPPGIDLPKAITETGPGQHSDILFAGRLVPTKNLGLLIDAVAELIDDGSEPNVSVIGDGPNREKWETQARRRGVDHLIHFHGAMDDWRDVISAIRGAKVVALPSLREGYGMVALEAAACGVPVVTVDHRRNASKNVVDHGVTGLCVPPDARSFAIALRTLLEDEELRGRMGASGREVTESSDWETVVATTTNLYAVAG